MRLKDISAIRSAVSRVTFARVGPAAWEIHFWVGAAMNKITKHNPADEARTWASLDLALGQAEGLFDQTEYSVTTKEQQ